MSYPGTCIYKLDEKGIEETDYKATEHYKITKQFIDNAEKMFGMLFDEKQVKDFFLKALNYQHFQKKKCVLHKNHTLNKISVMDSDSGFVTDFFLWAKYCTSNMLYR